jgi:splicing factor 1
METESGAKIAIRGKGSVKEGKGRSDAAHTSNQEEDLHCLIMADTEDKVNKAKQLIHNVIETVSCTHPTRLRYVTDHRLTPLQAASIPEGQNELKRNQLRELAALNGTLRDDENQACQNCGQIGHRKYDCPEQRNFTANIICRVCGNAGHMARDCPDRQRGQDWRNGDRAAPGAPGHPAGQLEPADTEFNNLMQELGAGGAITGSAAPARIEAGGYGDDRGAAKPWQRGPTGGPAPWAAGGGGGGREQSSGGREQSSGGPAPWAAGGGSGGGRASDSYGGGGYSGGHSSGGGGGAAPWQQQQSHAPPQQQAGYGGGYGGYGYGGAPGYDQGYGQAAAPAPGMAPWQQQGYGDVPPPPPQDDNGAYAPPPPPSEHQPPPPPPGA